jgi:hypothetical protein
MSQKRGQLSVFVIVGLIVVIVGALGIYLYTHGPAATPSGTLRGETPLSQLQGMMEDCVRGQAIPLLQRISAGGGTLTPTRQWKGDKYNILCVDTGITGCVNTMRTKKDIADEFNAAFQPLLQACLDFRPFERMGYTVERGQLATSTIVGFNDVTIGVSLPVTLTHGTDKISYDKQVVIVDSPLGQLHSLANVLLNQNVRLGYIDKDSWMTQHGNRFQIEIDRPYPDVTLTLATKDKNERPYLFRFAERGNPTAKTVAVPRPAPKLMQDCLINFDCYDNVPEALCTQKGGAVVIPTDSRCKPPFVDEAGCDGQACKPCDLNGTQMPSGSQWCDDTVQRDNTVDPVGSRFVKMSCNNGVIQVEPCRDYREEFCTEQQGVAACRVNRWFDCWSQTSKSACEDTGKRDCYWTDMLIPKTSDRPTDRCRPVVAPGNAHWLGTKTAVKNICDLGNEMWHEDLGVFSQAVHWKPYVPHATGEARFCQDMGDCGNKIGVSGVVADKRFKSRESGKPPQSTYFPVTDEMPKLPLNVTGFTGITAQTFYYPDGDTNYMQQRTDNYINWLISNAVPILLDQLPIYALHSDFCKNWMPQKKLQDCDMCEKSIGGCSEYLCRSLGRRCIFSTDIAGYPHCRTPGVDTKMNIELEFPGVTATKTGSAYRLDKPANPFDILDIRVKADRPTICVASLIPGLDGLPEAEDPSTDADLAMVRLIVGAVLEKSFDPAFADFEEPTTDQDLPVEVPDLAFLGRYDDKPLLFSFAANPTDMGKLLKDSMGLFMEDPILSEKIKPLQDKVDSLEDELTRTLQQDSEFNSLGNKVDLLLSIDGLRRDPRVLRVYIRCDDQSGQADSVQIPVEIPISKDMKPPVVLNVTPPAGGLTPSSVDILFNEPAECGYSMDVDKQFDDMTAMSCALGQRGSRSCETPLAGAGERHTLFVRCKDRPYAFKRGTILVQPGASTVSGGLLYSTDPLNVSLMPLTQRVSVSVPPKAGSTLVAFSFSGKTLCRYGTQNASFDRLPNQMECDDRHCRAAMDLSSEGSISFICANALGPYQNEMPAPYMIAYDGTKMEETPATNETIV